jgi:hypothetical protein
MRSLTVAAKDVHSANELHGALAQFGAELEQAEPDGYCVVVPLRRRTERQIIEVLDAIQAYVTGRNDGPARVDLDGRTYTMHSLRPPEPARG